MVRQEIHRSQTKPAIPDVCEALSIPWMTLPQFVNAQGWTLVRQQ